MSTAPLLIERQGAVETWTLNDPATRNALRDAAAKAFATGLHSIEAAQGLAAFARKQPAPWTQPTGNQP